MNVRDFARLTAREIRNDAQFWDDLSESVASRTVDRLRTLPPLQRRAYSVPEVGRMLGVGTQQFGTRSRVATCESCLSAAVSWSLSQQSRGCSVMN